MSYQGLRPKINTTKYSPRSSDPANPAEGEIQYADGTARAVGFWVYKSSAWVQLSSGSGSKNYFSLNNANPDFSSNSATPWSVFNTTFTNGVPGTITLTATNVTIPTTATNPLLLSKSKYNLQMVKTANNSQGQGFISTAMTIDREDLAKVLYGSFSYEVVSGTVDFSGTSTQSLEIWVYNVTAASWIQVSGYRGINQSSGQGKVVFNFQTDSTAANNSYQVAVILRQTDTNAITVNFNDFNLGPQSIVLGAPVTDFTSYVPTYQGFGTPTTTYAASKRVGDSIVLSGRITLGTTTGVEARIGLPAGLTVSSAVTAITVYGMVGESAGTSSFLVTALGGNSYITFTNVTGGGALANSAGSSFTSASSFTWSTSPIPVQGWSSNVQVSADTDTRVVAASYFCSANKAATTSAPIDFDSKDFDTHSAVTTGASWKFTAPISGIYCVNAATSASGTSSLMLYKNGSSYKMIGGAATASQGQGNSTEISLNAGDFIELRPDQSITYTGSTQGTARTSNISIYRLSGPSVVANTESVNARYFASATSLSGSLATINWTTKDYDTHGAMSSGTYTVPVAGKYQINMAIALTAGSAAAGNAVDIQIQKNGIVVSEIAPVYQGTQILMPIALDDIISCNAGDTIRVQVSSAATSPAITSSNSKNFFSIVRVGN